MTTNTEFNYEGIVYDVEHSKHGVLERVVIWTTDEEYVGDVLINHNLMAVRTQTKSMDDSEDASYDDITNMSNDEIARWLIDRA